MDFKEILDIISSSSTLIIGAIAVFVALLTYFGRGNLKVGNFSLGFDPSLEREVQKIRSSISEALPEANPAERQYLLLREYHAQGLAQSKISFWFSLVFASIGFAVIITAILTIDSSVQFTQQGRAFISLVSGTVIEVVSSLFFVQSNRARQLMTEFFDKLRVDRKLEESLKLLENIPDKALQSKLKTLVALNFAEVTSSDSVLTLMLDLQHNNQNRSSSTKRKQSRQKKTNRRSK